MSLHLPFHTNSYSHFSIHNPQFNPTYIHSCCCSDKGLEHIPGTTAMNTLATGTVEEPVDEGSNHSYTPWVDLDPDPFYHIICNTTTITITKISSISTMEPIQMPSHCPTGTWSRYTTENGTETLPLQKEQASEPTHAGINTADYSHTTHETDTESTHGPMGTSTRENSLTDSLAVWESRG